MVNVWRHKESIQIARGFFPIERKALKTSAWLTFESLQMLTRARPAIMLKGMSRVLNRSQADRTLFLNHRMGCFAFLSRSERASAFLSLRDRGE